MRSARPSRITLLTDFGTADGYVGAMKGVLAAILPDALIDDITHDIPPGDVAAAAWCVATFWRHHAPGTVHLCVVDPGVGASRRAIAAEADGQFFIAPDNGLLSDPLRSGAAVFEIADPRFRRADVSSTFHGRDIFAVAAAHVAAGTAVAELGPRVSDPILLPQPAAVRSAAATTGVVLHVDRFGNMITNIARAEAVAATCVLLPDRDDRRVRIVRTYADAAPGELVALFGSAGLLELAVRDGSAAERLSAARGMPVTAAADAEPEVRNVRSDH